jgi:cytoskeletal protein RodZ
MCADVARQTDLLNSMERMATYFAVPTLLFHALMTVACLPLMLLKEYLTMLHFLITSILALANVVLHSAMWVVQQLCNLFTTTTTHGETGGKGKASNQFANNKSKAVKNHQPQPSSTINDSTTSKPGPKMEITPAPSGAGDVDTAHKAGHSITKRSKAKRKAGRQGGPTEQDDAATGHGLNDAQPPGTPSTSYIPAPEVQVEVAVGGSS